MKKITNYIIPFFVALFNILIILYPKDIIGASKDGLSLWFNNVMPSLLPFIIGTNILTGLGVVSFIGTLLEPIMYPVFRVPGAGGFALAVGMTSGYPMGAKVTADLCKSKSVTPIEAQRLLAFCNNSGPLFILGAIGVSMFNNITVGYFILFIHYAAAITTGLIFRHYAHQKNMPQRPIPKKILRLAFRNLSSARHKDGRSFGELLGESIRNAMETVLLIGGFIIFFCVIAKVFYITGLIDVAVYFTNSALGDFGFPADVYYGSVTGLIEITNGAKILSVGELTKAKVILVAAIISFGGISIIAQSASFFGKSGIKVSVYILSKTIHALITVAYGVLFSSLLSVDKISSVSRFYGTGFFNKIMYSTLYFASVLVVVLVLMIIAVVYKSIKKGNGI